MIDHNDRGSQAKDGIAGKRDDTRAGRVREYPGDDEPTWPGSATDDDEGVADGMCDDDDDDRSPSAWLPWALGVEQPSPWDEAIVRLCVSRSSRADFA